MHPTRWGDPDQAATLPESARGLVEMAFGLHERPTVPGEVPASRLNDDQAQHLIEAVGADHVLTDDEVRRVRTRGKSTPDLLRARAGDLSDAPDVVVRPQSHAEVEAVLAVAQRQGMAVVPFGGGTCVTGGLAPTRDGFDAVVSLDLVRMNRLVEVDHDSMTARLEPGLRGPQAEALLAAEGMTLGHYPQSWEYASIGGFAATRSSGQSSAGYGRFDALVVGLTVATPTGSVDLGVSPSNAAGPDLRQVFLGSEGTLGIITSVTVRVRPKPVRSVYASWHWPSFADGAAAMRQLAQTGLMPTVLRLSDENETAINLARPDEIGGAESEGGCTMIVGLDDPGTGTAKWQAIESALTAAGGTPQGEAAGTSWAEGRFHAPYLRDALLDNGVLVETLETVTYWSNVEHLYAAVVAALKQALGDSVLVLCHISHVYETGCSLYFTVAAADEGEPLARWSAAKTAANDAIVAAGGSITHHHAVGRDHRDWLQAEIGDVGVRMLRALKQELDPNGILNPGVLIP